MGIFDELEPGETPNADRDAIVRMVEAARDRVLDNLTQVAAYQALAWMPVEPARHALWWFGDREYGRQPGGRDQKVMELLSVGDSQTIAAVVDAPVFTYLACAWLIGKRPGGLDDLRRKVQSFEAGTAARFGMPIPGEVTP